MNLRKLLHARLGRRVRESLWPAGTYSSTFEGITLIMFRPRKRLASLIASVVAVSALALPSTSLAGNWEWWGYRTNSYQTWALATQSPEFSKRTLPYFNVAAYVMGTSWRWNAQGARMVGQCTGITWGTTPIYTGCSRN